MDLILRKRALIGPSTRPTDIGIRAARSPRSRRASRPTARPSTSAAGWSAPGFIETHIHLDKSCILDRCRAEKGDLEEAIREVARAKEALHARRTFTRAPRGRWRKAILNGTTHMRTQLEVDPGIGLRGLEGVRRWSSEYAWAIDIEICMFPQEGLLNNPGTDELMVEALKSGGSVVGAAPYTDFDPHGQIDRIFAIAREFDIDIDMHLDFGPTAGRPGPRSTSASRPRSTSYGGRVAIGHVTKLSGAPPELFDAAPSAWPTPASRSPCCPRPTST